MNDLGLNDLGLNDLGLNDLDWDEGAIRVVGAAIVRDGLCLAARRSARMSAPLRWEFPGGKIERGEEAPRALERELHEELGITVEVGALVGEGRAEVDGRIIHLCVYWVQLTAGEPEPREHAELAWLGPEQLAALAWAAADVPIVPLVLAGLAASAR